MIAKQPTQAQALEALARLAPLAPIPDGPGERRELRDQSRPLTERAMRAKPAHSQDRPATAATARSRKMDLKRFAMHVPTAELEHQLALTKQHVSELQDVLARQVEIENEHRHVASLVPDERKSAREKERLLALELADVDAELDNAKSKLARAKAKSAATAAANFQRATKPITLEAAWACAVADGPGKYLITSPVDVSPRIGLLTPSDGELLGQLPVGRMVQVVEVIRLTQEKRIRGRIVAPFGWISLADFETGTRWAEKQISEIIDLDSVPSASLVQENAALRSTALRGWRAAADVQAENLQEVLQAALCFTGGLSGTVVSNFGSHPRPGVKAAAENLSKLSLPALSRRLARETMTRYIGTMQNEVKTEQLWRDLEVARMELADEESHVAALTYEVTKRQVKNRELLKLNLKLQHVIEKVENGRLVSLVDAFEGFWDGTETCENYRVPSRPQVVKTNRTEADRKAAIPPADESATGMLEDAGKAAQPVPVPVQVHVETYLRRANDCQRQRVERVQELLELRNKLAPLRSAAMKNFAGVHYTKTQCQQCRVQVIIRKLVGFAFDELETLGNWLKAIEGRSAWMLQGLGAPPEVRRSRLAEVRGEAPTRPPMINILGPGWPSEPMSRMVSSAAPGEDSLPTGAADFSRLTSASSDGPRRAGDFVRKTSMGSNMPGPRRSSFTVYGVSDAPDAEKSFQPYVGDLEAVAATEAEFLSSLRDAMAMFRPRGPSSDEPHALSSAPDGARALWALSALLLALQSYAQAEIADLPSTPPKGLESDRFGGNPQTEKEIAKRYNGNLSDTAAEQPPACVPPYHVG